MSVNTIVARLYVKFAALPDIDAYICNATGTTCGVSFKVSDSKLYACFGSETSGQGATGVTVTTNTLYRIDVKMTSGSPVTVNAQINGIAVGGISAGSGINFTTFQVGCLTDSSASADIYFDDLILSNTSADYPIGDGYVNHFVPTSDGTHNVAGSNDFERGTLGTDIINSTTDSYLLVDDVPMDDTTPDTNDYINCIAPANATDYVEHVFGPASGISTPTTGPRAVEVIYAHHEAGTGTGVSAFKLNDNATISDVYNPGSVAGATTTRYARAHFATAPSTGVAWTSTRFNALRCRFGYSSDANPDQYFDCAMIEAEFAPTTSIKTWHGLANSSTKTAMGLARASVKTGQGLA